MTTYDRTERPIDFVEYNSDEFTLPPFLLYNLVIILYYITIFYSLIKYFYK